MEHEDEKCRHGAWAHYTCPNNDQAMPRPCKIALFCMGDGNYFHDI